MKDKSKKSKAKHGRHAAPEAAPNDNPVTKGSTGSQPAVSVSASVPIPQASQVSQGQGTGSLPVSQQTAVMPQGVRSVPQQGSTGSQPAVPGYAPGNPMRPFDIGETEKKARKPLKILGIIFGVLLGLLAVVYVAGSIVFMDRFMPNTTVGEFDVSLKSSAEVQEILSEALDNYTLKVEGQSFALSLSARDAGMKLDAKEVTDAMHSSVNPWFWPLEITRTHDETDKFAASYNESGLGEKIRTAVDEFNKTATPPTNATVAYDSAKSAFVVVPEAVGTSLNCDAVIAAVDKAVIAMEPTLKLSKDELTQPTVLSTDQKLAAAAAQANTMIKANLVFTMAGTIAGEVNADLISQWIRFGDDLAATLDEEALVAWVNDLEARCDTVGTERTYTRPDGKVITVAGGVYGWSVDHDALMGMVKDGVANATVSTTEVPCVSTGTGYNGAGAQDWGLRYCDIDLSEQYVRFYDETGALIWEAPCVSGTPNGAHNTPTGVFWLNQKASPSKLKGTNLDGSKYETTVQYWMPFDGNVVGLHDADWQPAFGGTLYQEGNGSHGCVNLPPGKAAELYGIIQSGDVVVSHW